jgi:AmmeMemoRadiSam system protein B
MSTRKATVEGRFYPSTKSRIFDQIREIEKSGRYPEPDISPRTVYGAVLPHAGHIYSGYQTIPFFQLIKRHRLYPDTFVIIHPNHSGYGAPLALDDAEFWSNSIGEVPIDLEFARAMDIPFDHRAHAREHSAEVIVPFIQYFCEELPFSIVPVCMLDQSYKSASAVASSVIRAAKKTNRRIMVLASCDFSHYLPPAEGKKYDQLVLDQILERNAPGVEQAVARNRLSICGYGPIMSLMEYARSKTPGYRIDILARGHSGEIAPSMEVVDYISLMAYK